MADPTQIHQILINLCANAGTRWRTPGRIEVAVAASSWAAARPRGSAAQQWRVRAVVITDTGCGMDDQTVKRIFEPFFTTKRQEDRLGCPSCSASCRRQADPSRATSVAASVTVYSAAKPAVGDAEPMRQAAHGRGERLLLLDDAVELVRVMSRALERLGYRVTPFSDPRDALAAHRANPDSFDLIIADYEMPSVTGIDVAREMRLTRANAAIVLWSGRFTPEITSAAKRAGISHLVSKPCEPSELSRVIRGVIDRQFN
jgi:CheY-like chemotaxis protein